MIMTPARHYWEAQKRLDAADAATYRDDIDTVRLVYLSAIAHALLAAVDLQVYSDAKGYMPPEDAS